MSTKRSPRWNSEARQLDGCIVSFVSASGGELTLHRTGPLSEALRRACADALTLDPSFRVTCYSTPGTIADDLGGWRMDHDHAGSGHRADPPRPEVAALGQVGLIHLTHPSLAPGRLDNDAARRQRDRMMG